MEKFKKVKKPKQIIKSFVTLGEIVEKFPHGGKVTLSAMKRKKMIPKNVNFIGISSVVPLTKKYNIQANVFDGRVEDRMHQNGSTVTNIIYYSNKAGSNNYYDEEPVKKEKKTKKSEFDIRPKVKNIKVKSHVKAEPKVKKHISAEEKKRRIIIASVTISVIVALTAGGVIGGYFINKRINTIVPPTINVIIDAETTFDGTVEQVEVGKYKITQTPSKAGYTFGGWYLDSEFKNVAIGVDGYIKVGTPSNKKVTYNIYPKWNIIIIMPEFAIKVENTTTDGKIFADKSIAKEGDIVTITIEPKIGQMLAENGLIVKAADNIIDVREVDNKRTKYTFVMPSSHVDISAKFSVFFSVGLQIEVVKHSDPSLDFYKVISKGKAKDDVIVVPQEYDDGTNGLLPVKEVGSTAFINSQIISISVPSVIKIGEGAFTNCKLLTKLNMPNVVSIPVNAFGGCSSLETVDWEKVTSIGKGAFLGCDSLKTVRLPLVKNISENAFTDCKMLVSVDLPKIESIGNSAFKNCKSLSEIKFDVAKDIGISAFEDCIKLKEVNLEKAEKIGGNAFFGCEILEILIMNEVNYVGDFAFAHCTNLNEVVLPKVVEVGASAFLKCGQVQRINFPLATKIGNSAFLDCTILHEVALPMIEIIGDSAFEGYEGIPFEMLNLKYIGAKAFYKNEKIWESFPKVETVGESAFEGCLTLEIVNMPVVTTVGKSAFAGCLSLETVNMPVVKIIESKAFFGCEKLNTIAMPVVTEIGESALIGCKKVKIYISKDCKVPGNLWREQNCSTFAFSLTQPGAERPPSLPGTIITPKAWWHYDTDNITPTTW